MVRLQSESNARNKDPRTRMLKDQGKLPPGIKTQRALRNNQGLEATKQQQPVRKSPRLQISQQLREPFEVKDRSPREVQASCPPSTTNIPVGRNILQGPEPLQNLSGPLRKRKRVEGAKSHSPRIQDQSPPKRQRSSLPSCIVERRGHLHVASTSSEEDGGDPVDYWTRTKRWHTRYFEQDSQVVADFERGRGPERFHDERWFQGPARQETGMNHFLARKKSSASLRRKNSDSSLHTPSDQLSREVKSAPYRTPEYEIGLATKGSFMGKSRLGITDASKRLCQSLLEKDQPIPQDTLFRDDLFDETCESVRGRNEAMIIRDISPLICPSAQVLKIYGATHLADLTESVNEAWNSAIPFHGTRPQPDFSLGFVRSAFTEQQLQKLEPLVGDILSGSKYTSFFMATTRMYFPFLTCEVKCGAAALDVADRQNAHSTTIAVRGVVELFKAVKREKELHREVLAFSFSHDHRSVRISSHYPVIEDDKVNFWRHPIRTFDFTERDGMEKWTAYMAYMNILEKWKLPHLQRIRSAIDELPSDIDFDLSQSASFPPSGVQSSQQSDVEDDGQSSFVGSQEGTPTTSFSHTTERASKKPRNQRATR